MNLEETCMKCHGQRAVCGCDDPKEKILTCPICKGRMKDQLYIDGGEEHGNFYCLSVSCFMPPITFKGRVEHKTISKVIAQLDKSNGINNRLIEWLEWIAAHSVTETDVPGSGFPCLNMPPNEGASRALSGDSISEYDDR